MAQSEISKSIRRMRSDSDDDDRATTPRDWLARQGAAVIVPLCDQLTFASIFASSDVASPSNYLYYVLSVLKPVSLRLGDTSACLPALRLFMELDDQRIRTEDGILASSQRYLLELVKTIAPERLPGVSLGVVKGDGSYNQFVESLPDLRAMVQAELAR